MTRPSAARPFALVVSGAALAAIAFLTLNPGWIVGPLRGQFVSELTALTGIGHGLDSERILNALVPLGAAVAPLVPWRWGLLGAVVGLFVSTGVEVLQTSIPGRVSDPADILWNTAGAATGAVVVFALRAAVAGLRVTRDV